MVATPNIEITPQFAQAMAVMEDSTAHCLVTGKAGTGKSTLLQYFRAQTKKQVAVVAPTGVAAVNIGGQTIHSFCGFRTDITPEKARKAGRRAAQREEELYLTLQTLVIDEISMVRADLFDCLDHFLRAARHKPRVPFGGVQLVMIGDLYQLPPVVTREAREIFTTAYASPYFFDAPVYAALTVELIELEKIYRQQDTAFIALLNAVRNNSITPEQIAQLNARYLPHFVPEASAYITLTSTNQAAATINAAHLQALRGRAMHAEAEVDGEFGREQFPTEANLSLKVGAQVMLLNNDVAGRWVNGTIGAITALRPEAATVVVKLETGATVEVGPYTWHVYQYVFDAAQRRLQTEARGAFTQYPLRLAWAVTIHKSQGKTFDRVVIDVGRGTFASGQMYVALSRCRTLEGIVLRQRLRPQHVRVDYRIQRFLTGYHYARSEAAMPLTAKIEALEAAIADVHPVRMTYLKASDVRSERVVQPIAVGEMEYQGRSFLGLHAYCRERGEARVFRVDRILQLEACGEE